MSVTLDNKFSFPQSLVAKAAAFPTGSYVEVRDEAFEQNDLGRKILQTQLVQVGGHEVSVGYLSEGDTPYELILLEEEPRDLGTFDSILRGNAALFAALQEAFGGSMASYSHTEMVMAIAKANSEAVEVKNETQVRKVAAWARSQAKRASWVLRNRMDALVKAPVDWNSVGL